MAHKNFLFTSESVSEGHPDKVCDRISDTIVDAYLSEMPEARVACETLATTNRVVIAGEPRRMPLVTIGFSGSFGIAFLFVVIPARSSTRGSPAKLLRIA